MRELTKKALAMQLIELCETIPLKDISIRSYIEFAGISKQTFYNHFKDKADLMNYAYMIASEKIVDDMSASLDSFHEGAVKMAKVCKKNPKFYIQLARYETQNDFLQYFTNHCEEVYKQMLTYLHGEDIIDSQLEHVIRVYCVGVCTFFVEWIRNGMKESPGYVAKIIMASMPHSMKYQIDGKTQVI